jgi:hypothetical protein
MTQAAALANGDHMSAAELAIEGSSPEMREPEAYRGQQHDGDHVVNSTSQPTSLRLQATPLKSCWFHAAACSQRAMDLVQRPALKIVRLNDKSYGGRSADTVTTFRLLRR